jgi:hypothetical protein
MGYGYALNGNVASQTITAGSWSASQSYGYDGVNRLASGAEGSAWSQQYGHDQYGNH